MEMLNNVSMMLGADFWQTIISWFAGWIVNYGWAIIVFTIALKLVLSPLDILQRSSSAKQQKVMAGMKPELDAIQQKYGNNREKLNQETAKIYKKHNVSMGGMCFTMLFTMVLTMVVFFTLFGSLRSFGEAKLYSTYSDLDKSYQAAQVYIVDNASEFATEEAKQEYVYNVVKETYIEQSKQNSWLWVKNVWKSDTNISQLVSFDAYADHEGLTEEARTQAEVRYNYISDVVENENPGDNGYYVLIILAGVISFLTQFLSAKLMTPKGQKLNTMNKVMFGVIPITMIILAMSSNVVFTLYVIVNSLMTAIISTIITLITKKRNQAKPEEILLKRKNIEVVEYSRNYKR